MASSPAQGGSPDSPALERDRSVPRRQVAPRKPENQPGAKPQEARSEARDKSPTAQNEKPGQSAAARIATIRRHPVAAVLIVIFALIAVAGVVVWWLNARHYESTDDAFIDARTVSISSQVNAAIVEVPVDDNQAVEAGMPLARLDDRDFRAAVEQAKSRIDQAVAGLANLDAQIEAQRARIDQAQKQVDEAQATLTFAQQEDARAQDLFRRGAGTQQQAQQTASNLRQDQAGLDAAQANLVAAQKQIAVLQTQRQAAAGQLEQANAAKEQAD